MTSEPLNSKFISNPSLDNPVGCPALDDDEYIIILKAEYDELREIKFMYESLLD